MKEKIKSLISSHIETTKELEKKIELIQSITSQIIKSLREGGKILICGNGGSASQAEHFSAELVGRFKKERFPLAALALTTNTAILTALGNDFGFEHIFSKQISALGNKKDTVIFLSTSGNSLNLIKAAEVSEELGIYTIGILGKGGGRLKEKVKLSLIVDSQEVPRIQEVHSLIIHIICELIEEELFK
ncbi:MAG TPA: SIS domain-containing protein [Candidatus Omnitrophica bacterium]|nr:MAG: phosphoheptose isomerase [Candidatus Omnitrophota bacterium]RKY44694.1 MAG: phosphoheptose isomerase [Candidatus Omnitrophota bacterium]HEC68776.1 SIS domain-containing protein [Candidatus Omnitrophota bacterium]